jgi:hypothetical protein
VPGGVAADGGLALRGPRAGAELCVAAVGFDLVLAGHGTPPATGYGAVGAREKELGLAHHPWACLAAGTHFRLVDDQPGNQLSVGCGLREHYMLRATR